MRRIPFLFGLSLICPLLSFGSDLSELLCIPPDNILQIRGEFENLSNTFPVVRGIKLGYNEGRGYKIKKSIEFSEKLDSLIPDAITRGYLFLRLSRIYFGAGGQGNELELKGLACFITTRTFTEHRYTTESLLKLCEKLKDLDDRQQTDIYGFCSDIDYYNRMLLDEQNELSEYLNRHRRDCGTHYVEARQLRRQALAFLKSVGLVKNRTKSGNLHA